MRILCDNNEEDDEDEEKKKYTIGINRRVERER